MLVITDTEHAAVDADEESGEFARDDDDDWKTGPRFFEKSGSTSSLIPAPFRIGH